LFDVPGKQGAPMSHPQQLGKYQITEVLGEGAMGVVYKGFDPDIRRVVALKTIRRQLDDGSEFAVSISARFRNEAQAAGRLAHPGIVGVYDYGEDQRVAFIAMEFIEGQSLARYLGSKLRFTDADIPGVMSQLLDALDHAHQQGVWHRDIKPANIMLGRAGRLKVADFGIARIEGSNLTQATAMIGTPSYMAPEQFLGQAIDHRVDIYSAGVVLYLLLTGKAPFTGPQESLMYKAVHEMPAPPSAVEGANRPRFYDAIVATALAKDPARRYASASAFKDAIVRAVGQPIDQTAWEQTIVSTVLPPIPRPAPMQAGPAASAVSMTTGTSQVSGWDPAVLAQAEHSLARHVGPLASVLVKRAARECGDLQTLYVKLGEQVGNEAARATFLGQASGLTMRGGGTSLTGLQAGSKAGLTAGTAVPAEGSVAGGAPVNDALIEQAARLLAQHVGPIAKVVARKAAARAPQRDAFFALLAESVDVPTARTKLLADLARLP
jgi:eukaryotic-like serine/threonine-protein kinase